MQHTCNMTFGTFISYFLAFLDPARALRALSGSRNVKGVEANVTNSVVHAKVPVLEGSQHYKCNVTTDPKLWEERSRIFPTLWHSDGGDVYRMHAL